MKFLLFILLNIFALISNGQFVSNSYSLINDQRTRTIQLELINNEMKHWHDSVISITDAEYAVGGLTSDLISIQHLQRIKNSELSILINKRKSLGDVSNNFYKNGIGLATWKYKSHSLSHSIGFQRKSINYGEILKIDSSELNLGLEFLTPLSSSNQSIKIENHFVDTLYLKKNTWTVGLENEFVSTKYTYTGNGSDTSFYAQSLLSSTEYIDELFTKGYQGNIVIGKLINHYEISVFGGFNYNKFYGQVGEDYLGQSIGARTSYNDSVLKIKLNTIYHISGFDKGGFEGVVNGFYKLDSVGTQKVFFKSKLEKLSAIRTYSKYNGNHYNYDFNSELSFNSNSTLGLDFNSVQVRLNFETNNNLLYFKLNELPFYGNSQSSLEFYASKTTAFKITENKAFVNVIPVQSDLIRKPLLTVGLDQQFGVPLFKKKLQMLVGVTAIYETKYYGNGIDPARGVFVLQDEVEVGGYPYLGAYVNFKLKGAGFYLKVDHINQDWMGRGYTVLPNSLAYGRRVWFGLNWKFTN